MISHPERELKRARQRGVTLIETMIASVVLLIGFVATMGVFTVAVGRNASQGDVGTRVTEYAQDKMEQLMALSFTDSASNTTVYPTAASGGTGLGGSMAGSTTVGSTSTSSPTAGYVDYLTESGTLQTTSTGAYYTRAWSITTNAAANEKTITVVAQAVQVSGSLGAAPSTTLVCVKSTIQ